MMSSEQVVVVGVDGTPGARAAVRWAAEEAERRHAAVVIVHADDTDPDPNPGRSGLHCLDIATRHAETVVADAEQLVRATAPGVTVRAETGTGPAIPVLLASAGSAVLLVVGSRCRGGFAALLLGSVAQAVAARASCPVVVVQGRPGDGPVVVGVDGSPAGAHALELAFEEAASHHCLLLAVRAFLRPAPPWIPDIAPSVLWLEESIAAERRTLDDLLAPCREKYPQVRVEPVVSRQAPADALADASSRARLVVVGSRGGGRFAGALLGSVGLRLLRRAGCPVMIVHA